MKINWDIKRGKFRQFRHIKFPWNTFPLRYVVNDKFAWYELFLMGDSVLTIIKMDFYKHYTII